MTFEMIRIGYLLVLLTCTIAIRSSDSRHYKPSRSVVKDVRQNDYYDFHYYLDHEDSSQFRKETRKDGQVIGSYGIVDPDGRKRTVYYIADENGFRAKIDSNEPGMLAVNPADVDITKSDYSNNQIKGASLDDSIPSFSWQNGYWSTNPPSQTKTTESPKYLYPIPLNYRKPPKMIYALPVSYTVEVDHNEESLPNFYITTHKPSGDPTKSPKRPIHVTTNSHQRKPSGENYMLHNKRWD